MGNQIGRDYQGRIHVPLPQQVHGGELAGIVARIAPGEVQAEGKAIEIGGDLVEAGDIAVSSQCADHELGVAVQLLHQVERCFRIAVLSIRGGDSQSHVDHAEIALLHQLKHLFHLGDGDACDRFYGWVRALAVQQCQ